MNEDQTASALRQRVLRLRRLDACAVSDALDRLKLGTVVTGVTQLSGEGRIAGQLTTVLLGTGAPPPGPPKHLCATAIELSGPDHIIAIEQRSGVEAGSWGGLLTLGAKVRGVAGVVVDGPVRDIDESRQHGFPVFASSLTALTARGRIVEKGTNVPITLWGHAVSPGDYVLADRSAIIIISAINIDTVIDTAETIVDRELAMGKAILSGKPISQVMGGDYEHMLK
jgi:4-hydroxy-4-methyl-2-oxoglutarate aldolase